jgi:sec-independent protein translocase protein TatB
MFDIGFWEMALIAIIGLVVLGPERLPGAMRSIISWINSAKSIANSVKSDLSQELKLHEMNEDMIKASKKGLDALDPELKKSIEEMKKSAQDLTRPYKSAAEDLKQSLSTQQEAIMPEENTMLDDKKKSTPQDKSE